MMEDDVMPQEERDIERKHSGLGIASFIISLAQGVVTAIVLVLAGVYAVKGPQEENEVAFMIIGFAIIGGIVANLVGLGLGIAGVVQKDRKKVFSVLGLVFNIFAVLIVVAIIILGLTVG